MLQEIKEKPILLQDLGMMYPKETSKKKKRYGLYKCKCGKEFKAEMSNVKSGHTSSCGCYALIIRKLMHKKNGLSNHKLYDIWSGIIGRCKNTKNHQYKYYGGRGITVCERWLDVKNFIDDMYPSFEEGLTLDRIDVNGNYEPSNCRWSSRIVQSRNTRVLYSHNTSGYRGVSYNKKLKKWESYITLNRKKKNLGLFDTSLDGAKAYNNYVTTNNFEHTLNML